MTVTTSSVPASIDIVYSNTDPTTNGGISNFIVTISCSNKPSVGALKGNNTAGYTITQTSPDACPIFTLSTLLTMVEKFRWIFGLLFIGIGGFLSVFGRKFFP